MKDKNLQLTNLRWLAFSWIAGIVVMGIKFLAYYITHSNAILSDALESIINVVAGGVAFASVYFSSLPKDANHPYGHGKIEFLSAGFEGAIIVIAGLSIIVKGIYNLFYPNDLHSLDIGIVLVILGGAANLFLGWALVRNGKSTHSAATIASGKHLLSDTYSSIALLIGLLFLYFTNITWIDPVLAIIMGGFILTEGYKLVRGALSGILDEADLKLIEKVVEVLEKNRNPNWIDIHNLRIIKYGSGLHIDCHLTLPWYFGLKEAHEEIVAVEKLIKNHFHNRIEFFIHIDPCEVLSCEICLMSSCKERQHPFIQRKIWELDNVIKNEKHSF